MAIADHSAGSLPSDRWRSFKGWLRISPPPGPLCAQDRCKALIRIGLVVIRKFRSDEIPLRASALTFTVILSLVPLLALGTAVLKEVGVAHNFRQTAHRFVDQLDRPLFGPPAEASHDAPPGPDDPEAATAPLPSVQDGAPPGIPAHLRRAIDRIFDYVERTNFATIGVAGVIGFVVSALVLFGSIETALNAVWQVENSRSLVRRILDYLALVLLLPPALNAALAAEAALKTPLLHNHLPAILHLNWVGQQFFRVFPVALMIVSLIILYAFLPNTRVRFRSALAGGLVAGGSWFVVQIAYLHLQIGVARYNAIYGSFATLPLFLLWLYFGWLTFLIGSIISFATQHWRTSFWDDRPMKPLARLAVAGAVVREVRKARREGDAATLRTLASGLRLPESLISSVLTELCDGNVLCGCRESENSYRPVSENPETDRSGIAAAILGAAEGEGEIAAQINRALAAAPHKCQR